MENLKGFFLALMVLMTFTLSSCDIIGGIFEAGMWVMLIIIVLIVLIIGWIIRKLRGPRRPL